MKIEVIMGVYNLAVLSILFFTSFCDSVQNNKSSDLDLLERMRSDEKLSNCGIFSSEDLYKSQLFRICNVRLWNVNEIEENLKYDVTPLLCMAFYDKSIKLCEESSRHSELTASVPKTVEGLMNLLTKLEVKGEYSNIYNFCNTIDNNTLGGRTNSSYETEKWINFFNQKLKDKQECIQICGGKGLNSNKVHPLCSFVKWSDSLVFNIVTSALVKKNHEGNDTVTTDNVNNRIKNSTIKNDDQNTNLQNNKEKLQRLDVQISSSNNTGKHEEEISTNNSNNLQQQTENIVHQTYALNTVDNSLKSDQKTTLQLNHTRSKNNQKSGGLNDADKGAQISEEQSHIEESGTEEKTKLTPNQQKPTVVKTQSTDSTIETVSSQNIDKELLPQIPVPKVPEHKDDGVANPVKEQEEKQSVNEDVNDLRDEQDNLMTNNDDPEKNDDENHDENQEIGIDDSPVPIKDSKQMMALKQNKDITVKEKADTEQADDDDFITQDDHFIEAEDSHFFTNFLTVAVLCIIAYIVFHNKKKLLALAVEGKRRGPTRRRPNTASYSKLDCNLEEAMVSNTTASVTHVLY